MVGLAAVAEFTHGIEAVLERIRGDMLAVDSDIITTLLECATISRRWSRPKQPGRLLLPRAS